jgi:hypothetical protein
VVDRDGVAPGDIINRNVKGCSESLALGRAAGFNEALETGSSLFHDTG